jgi:DNA mismatch repair ATPase MutS
MLKKEINNIPSIANSSGNCSSLFTMVSQFFKTGQCLKCFYGVYANNAYHDAIIYSFGICGFINNLSGLINNKHIHFCKFTNNRKKTQIKQLFYGPHCNNSHSDKIKNNVKLNKNLIITGPNASGKTTILKSTLINIILSQQFGCGFYKSATLKPYHYFHCYLNSPDTMNRDSLFQAEARRCKNIIDSILKSDKEETHFCIFDELYSGTNPDDSVMSAYAFLKYLGNNSNVDWLLTTHFLDVCKKLDGHKNIRNYHMKTDVNVGSGMNGDDDELNKKINFKYTYVLKKGISKNNAGGLKVLCDLNYPSKIIQTCITSS